MKRNLGGIEGDASARAQTGRVGMSALHVVEPEAEIVLTGIVLNQGKLRPTHGFVKPVARGEGSRVSESVSEGERGNGESRSLQEVAARPQMVFHRFVPTLFQYDKFIVHEFR